MLISLTALVLSVPPGLPQGTPDQVASGEDSTASLGETLVTPSRFAEELRAIPFTVDALDRDELRARSYRTMPQALRDVPGVVVQETSHGQGSPFVRGWTGFRNLVLIDGVRLNNSVFRDGPNQYWSTVDVYGADRLEIVKGPGSVLYGTDAIGGTVQVFSRSPWSLLGPEDDAAGQVFYRVHSAEESHVGRFEGAAALGDSTAIGVGLTTKHFGDFQGGEELGTLENTGYDEFAGDLRLEHELGAGRRLVVGHNRVHQDDVPRTHSTIFGESWEGTSVGSDLRRNLDQDRELTLVQLHGEDVEASLFGLDVDGYTIGLSWHSQEELQDRIRSSGSRRLEGFDTDTLGLQASATAASDVGRWTFGLDLTRDFVDSFSNDNPVQGPIADDSTYDLFAVYVQDEIQVAENTRVIAGVRGQYAAADANEVSDPVTGLPTSIDEDWSQLVGSLRATQTLTDETMVFAGVSQGFRAPNLSDLTRFSAARSNEFEIPSPDLDPETFVAYELGIRHDGEHAGGGLSVYYTDVSDLIIRRPTGNVNTDGDFEVSKENAGDGHVVGVEAAGTLRLNDEFSVFGALTWTDGEVETFPTSDPVRVEEPITRLLPWFGNAGVRYDVPDGDGWVELQATFAGEADELSTRDANDTQRIPPGGTPGYVVFDLRGGFTIPGTRSRVELGLENVLDEDYRVHGSGSNRPGRGIVIGWTLEL